MEDFSKFCTPGTNNIFVFGSNLSGRHGAGAALTAQKVCGAVRGIGVGFVGNSYAIPTKGHAMEILRLPQIEAHVREFLDFATKFPQYNFYVTAIGCGLAGYKPEQIAPMFEGYTSNCILNKQFAEFYGKLHTD